MKNTFKKITPFRTLIFGVLILFAWLLPPASAADQPSIKSETILRIRFPIPKDTDEKRYLGISGGSYFKISQMKATVVIIEIFSLYCPQCQASAPEVNALYRMIGQVPDFKDRIKMIGVGAGNSVFEANTFKEQYKIPFPLFPDQDFKIHKQLGEVRTPYFIVIKIKKDRTLDVVRLQEGAFGESETFLQQILKASGLK